ncbi:MAG: S41 family peptidase [Alistipes sp.]|nr:S41 family peptidase [Alistipes sp.]
MKKTIATAILLAAAVQCVIANPAWLWPVAGRHSGDGILYRPQQYIGERKNMFALFVGCDEGGEIIAPADGEIVALHILGRESEQYTTSYEYDPGRELRPQAEAIATASKPQQDSKYICGAIGIRLDVGRTLTVSGVDLEPGFKTGQRIRASERIGTAGYSYKRVESPSICIEVSDGNGRPADPMTPFGIATTYIPPKTMATKQRFTADEARADILALTAVLREAYPSLDDVIAADELDRLESAMLDSVAGCISRERLYKLMSRLQGRIHDSHITLYPDEHSGAGSQGGYPQIFFGWFDGQCRITMTAHRYSDLIGRRIVRINGEDADSIRMRIENMTGGYDGRIESVIEERLAIYSTCIKNNAGDTDIVLDDGTHLETKGIRLFNPQRYTRSFLDYVNINRGCTEGAELHIIDDSVAYVGIPTFPLSEVETDRIISFIGSVADMPAMIVDLRNNGGGDTKVLNRILSSILHEPSRARGDIMQVKRRGDFSSFRDCCLNYPDTIDIFPEYMPKEGLDGYWNDSHSDRIATDTVVNYKGRVYVLTNAMSRSAATIFPAEIVRNRRGVVVGRETGTAYHFMTAYKFADIRLPESGFQWRIPLVKVVYDTTRCERLPEGRGVMPDYPVDLTFDEIYNRPDSILQYALHLIAEGRYLSEEDPFADIDSAAEADRDSGSASRWPLIAAIVAASAGAAAAAISRRRRR